MRELSDGSGTRSDGSSLEQAPNTVESAYNRLIVTILQKALASLGTQGQIFEPQPMLTTLKRSAKSAVLFAAEGTVAISSAVATPIALAFGKLFLAAILCALALGIFLRFAGRKTQPVAVPAPTPWWICFCSALLSLIEVVALVEATNLPIRFDQSGFEKTNWVLVLIALTIAYVFQSSLFKNLFLRSNRKTELVLPSESPSSVTKVKS